MTNLPSDTIPEAMMLSVRDVAKTLQCSDRHVTNLRKEGRMPPCIKLGTLVRWPRQVIEKWIAEGCPEVANPDSEYQAQSGSPDDRQAA